MNIYNHIILYGEDKNETIKGLLEQEDGLKRLIKYKDILNDKNNPGDNRLYLEVNKLCYLYKYKELIKKIINYHCGKVKDKKHIDKDYLNYISLKYTDMTMMEIEEKMDIEALNKIITSL